MENHVLGVCPKPGLLPRITTGSEMPEMFLE